MEPEQTVVRCVARVRNPGVDAFVCDTLALSDLEVVRTFFAAAIDSPSLTAFEQRSCA